MQAAAEALSTLIHTKLNSREQIPVSGGGDRKPLSSLKAAF
jgi:hypothetical protein